MPSVFALFRTSAWSLRTRVSFRRRLSAGSFDDEAVVPGRRWAAKLKMSFL